MKHSNISIFVPHAGCPHRCSFCNQRTISGAQQAPTAQEVRVICEKALAESKSPENTEIAFFGGSFTAIPREYMTELLEAVQSFIGEGKFRGIRISTRPDCIDGEILSLLKKYGVTAIELGAQSMDNYVLEMNERGHTAEDVYRASAMIKEYGFELGLQVMIGLYKSLMGTELATIDKVCEIKPDTVRIYPVVILRGTRLAELYLSGEYSPLKTRGKMRAAIQIAAIMMEKCEKSGIRVIKCGLHASEFVEQDMIGGFYHPAFRELCEGHLYREKLKGALGDDFTYAKVSVPSRKLSKAIGQGKSNIEYFGKKGKELVIVSDSAQTEDIKIIERR